MPLAEGTTVGYPSASAQAAIEQNRKKKRHQKIDSPGHARKQVKPRARSVDIESVRARPRSSAAKASFAESYARDVARARSLMDAVGQVSGQEARPADYSTSPQQAHRAIAAALAAAATRSVQSDVQRSAAAAPGPAQGGRNVLDFVLGPNLAAHVNLPGVAPSTHHASAAGTAFDAAMLFPIFRGPKALAAGVRAAREGETVARAATAARAAYHEPVIAPLISRLRGRPAAGAEYAGRSIRVGSKDVQLPRARSRITQNVIEKPSDVVSRKLENTPVRDIPLLKLATSSQRGAKAAGRATAQDAERAAASFGRAAHALKTPHTKKGRISELAHWWWAQLPKSHRNAEGLRLVRRAQQSELEKITSGKMLSDLEKRQKALLAEHTAAEQGYGDRSIYEVKQDLQDVSLLIQDLPQRAEDLGRSISQLDKAIAKTPALQEKKLEALRALSEDRKATLIEAGQLDPERALQREGLVSRWVGLTPTGEEVYLGHRLDRPPSSSASGMPGSVATGRVRLPQGVATENKLVLAKTGRASATYESALRDWHASRIYKTNLRVRKDLGQMGAPLEGTRVPEGHVLVNPKGRPIPKSWKMPQELHDGGFDPEELDREARKIVDEFYGETPEAQQKILDAAKEAGTWKELRILPKDTAERYFAQFTAKQRGGPVLSAYDRLVDLTAASIVFGRIGYIPKNAVQNLVMAVPHQGAYLLPNAIRAGQVLRDPELRALARAEVGFSGATRSVGREARSRKVFEKVAGFVGTAADDPLRISAFLHEASAMGVIGRAKPWLTEKDRAALIDLFKNPKKRALLNDVRSRAVEAMADFSRMTPAQRKNARRILIIPGWLMAGTRYPFHFAGTHPIRSALLAYAAMGEPGAPDRLQLNSPITTYFAKNTPSWAGGLKADKIPVIGGPGKVLRTNALSPVSTPYDIGGAIYHTATSTNPYKRTSQIFDYANPLAAAGIRAAQGEGLSRSLTPLAPNVSLVRGLVHPKASKYYPQDVSRIGRVLREVGIVPIQVTRSKTLTSTQMARSRVFTERDQVFEAAKRYVPDELVNGRLPQPLRTAYNRMADVEATRAYIESVTDPKTPERERAKYAAEIDLLLKWGAVSKSDADRARKWAVGASYEQLVKERSAIRYEFFNPAYLTLIGNVKTALEDRGATFGG